MTRLEEAQEAAIQFIKARSAAYKLHQELKQEIQSNGELASDNVRAFTLLHGVLFGLHESEEK